MEKTLRIGLFICTSLLFLFAILSIVNLYHGVHFFFPWGYWLIAATSLVTLIVLALISRTKTKYELSNSGEKIDRACTCTTKEECTYSSRESCPYEKTKCVAFPSLQKKTDKRRVVLCIVAALSVISFVLLLKNESAWAESIRALCVSLFAAIVIAFLIDIRGRMREYQEYFVNLLSSNDYLNHLDDDALSKLRNRIIWVMHAKDYPNMPRSIIDLDEKLCLMLRKPFFKTFTQIIKLSKASNNGTTEIIKHCNVVYKALNPGKTDNPVSVDIGLSNSVIINNAILNDDTRLKEEAVRILKIKSFRAYIDDCPTPYNLIPYIRIVVMRKNDPSGYNAQIHIAPAMTEEADNTYSNKEKPLNTGNMKLTGMNTTKNDTPGDITNISADIIGNYHNVDLFLQFKKHVIIEFEYDIIVPSNDYCFTKMLRYPVKYFKLDYSLGEGFENEFLTGKLIGTLIEPPDLSTHLSTDKKTISFLTQSWLLPKNGVFIAHCKE